MKDINTVILVGKVNDRPVFDRKKDGVEYYKFSLSIKRLSEVEDNIPITITQEHLEIVNQMRCEDEYLVVYGKLRSYNKNVEGRRKLFIHVEATEVKPNDIHGSYYYNDVEIEGHVCQKPLLRQTSFQKKYICDTMVCLTENVDNSLNRKRNSYIPIIMWDGLAEDFANCNLGEFVCFKGRLQSRDYIKKENGKEKKYTTIELSVGNVIRYNR